METYLTLLYVTIEQEVALKELFLSKGWLYAKPDLSVLTSNVGPPESFTSTGGIVKFTDDNGATEQRAKIVHPKVVENEDGIVEDTCVKVEYDDEYGGDTDEVLTGQDYDDDDYNADDHDDDDDFADLVEAAEPVNEAPKETRKSPRNRSKKTKAKSVLTNQKTAQVISFQADGSLAQTVKETPKSKKRKVDGAEVGEGEAVDREDMMKRTPLEKQLKLASEMTAAVLCATRGQSTVSCPKCNKPIKRAVLKRHLITHLDIQFQCKQCSLYYETREAMNEHIDAKHKKTFVCNTCGVKYQSKNALKEHMLTKHSGSPFTHPCPVCGKGFSRQIHLTDHMNIHDEASPYTCHTCGKSYKNRSAFRRHTAECGNSSSMPCEICGITCSNRSSLNEHISYQHLDSSYSCECGLTFKSRCQKFRHRKACDFSNSKTREPSQSSDQNYVELEGVDIIGSSNNVTSVNDIDYENDLVQQIIDDSADETYGHEIFTAAPVGVPIENTSQSNTLMETTGNSSTIYLNANQNIGRLNIDGFVTEFNECGNTFDLTHTYPL